MDYQHLVSMFYLAYLCVIVLWACTNMMTSSNGSIFRVAGLLCGEFICHRWIPLTNASDAELWCFLWINVWANNREDGDLRRHTAHYDVTVMTLFCQFIEMDTALTGFYSTDTVKAIICTNTRMHYDPRAKVVPVFCFSTVTPSQYHQ